MARKNKQQASGKGFGQNRYELAEWDELPEHKAGNINICKMIATGLKHGLVGDLKLPLFEPSKNSKQVGFVKVYQFKGVGIAFNQAEQLYFNYRY
jgi:hypothetical protein